MMNTETLRALLMDRELGELPPDIRELLDAYVEAVPAARAEAEATTRTVSVARDTVQRYPDLLPAAETKVIPIFLWLMRAAAVIAIVAAGWFVYRTGKTAPPVVESRVKGVWAQYQVAYDSHHGRFVVAQQD
jgi:hypothetical protein